MGLWGKSRTAESRPKFLPIDSQAAGSMGARENAIATDGGWALSPGLAASGNDNADAQPEVLVCIRNLADSFGSANVISIDWSQGAVADTGTFDITVTFDEAVDITSAARTANQTVTNKAYILLSRLGQTDMVEDSTMACQYYSGTGTNQLVFRGLAQTNAAAGYLAFNGAGVGDTATAGVAAIVFDGTAVMNEEGGHSALGIMQEEGTQASPADRIVQDTAANAGDEILLESIPFTLAGVNGTTNIMTGVTFTGGDAEVYIGLLEDGASDDQGEDKLIMNGTDGSSTNANDGFLAEDKTSDIAVYTEQGSSTGSASILNGVTVTAS